MVDFDVILGMDWSRDCFVLTDYRTRIVKFNFPQKLIKECREGSYIPRGRIISCLKACKIFSKDCLHHIVRVKDLDSKNPPIY